MQRENVVRLFAEAPAPQGDFESVWKLWPNKANKVMARQKYLAIIGAGLKTRALDKDSGQYVDMDLSATPDAILAGVKAYLASQIDKRTFRLRDDGKYIPHLATWLNRGRWEDFE